MEDGESPEYSGSFLFLVSLAQEFQKCNIARQGGAQSIQNLISILEGLALMLTGYYDTKDKAKSRTIEKEVQDKIVILRNDIDKIMRRYETGDLEIPKNVWLGLYELERELRDVWKKSGLQMALKNNDDLGTW